jgi:hypothetical protein
MGIADAIVHMVETCNSTSIPSVEPLDVPEVTTWGESGGADAVCLSQRESTSMVLWTLGDSMVRRADHWAGFWWMTGDRVVENTDIVTAINYVAGVKR